LELCKRKGEKRRKSRREGRKRLLLYSFPELVRERRKKTLSIRRTINAKRKKGKGVSETGGGGKRRRRAQREENKTQAHDAKVRLLCLLLTEKKGSTAQREKKKAASNLLGKKGEEKKKDGDNGKSLVTHGLVKKEKSTQLEKKRNPTDTGKKKKKRESRIKATNTRHSGDEKGKKKKASFFLVTEGRKSEHALYRPLRLDRNACRRLPKKGGKPLEVPYAEGKKKGNDRQDSALAGPKKGEKGMSPLEMQFACFLSEGEEEAMSE